MTRPPSTRFPLAATPLNLVVALGVAVIATQLGATANSSGACEMKLPALTALDLPK